MPQPGDRFPSFNNVHLTAVKAIVPVYGTSVHAYSVTANSGFIKCNRRNAYWKSSPEGICPFSLSVKRDPSSGTWSTQADGSYSEHNHGPARELLADPSWLPTIVNEDARAALGLPPGKRARAKMKEEKGDKRKKKKQKRTVKLKKPVEQPSTSTSFSSSAHPSSSLPKTPAAHHQQPPFQAPQHPFQSQQPLHPPPFPPQPHPALSPSSPPKPSSSWSTSDLSAFLSSIHPSVSPLAPNFLAAGVNSFDNLVSLSLMEPETLRSFIDVVSRQGDGGTGGISALQAKLLVKESRMAGGS